MTFLSDAVLDEDDHRFERLILGVINDWVDVSPVERRDAGYTRSNGSSTGQRDRCECCGRASLSRPASASPRVASEQCDLAPQRNDVATE